jgi:L-methionine (R)-S-oxide reductase
MAQHQQLLEDFRKFARSAPSIKDLMQHIVQRLHDQMARYNWVGFYEVDKNDPGILVVGSYAGSFIPNDRIPLNIGLCGTAASSGETVVVDDVSKDPRYLAGSPLVKSEIVVPIFVKKKLAMELDIESYFTATFNKTEQTFVETCAAIVAEFLARA